MAMKSSKRRNAWSSPPGIEKNTTKGSMPKFEGDTGIPYNGVVPLKTVPTKLFESYFTIFSCPKRCPFHHLKEVVLHLKDLEVSNHICSDLKEVTVKGHERPGEFLHPYS